jgi:hypothetical protein
MEHFSLKKLGAKGLSEEGSFTGDPKRYVKEIYQERCNNALYVSICLHRGPVGEPGGDSLAGTLERK